MGERVQNRSDQDSSERQFGNWRGVIAAWVLVLVFFILVAGVHAVASLGGSPHSDGHLAGTVIPRHDAACGGPGIPSAQATDGCEAMPLNEDRSAYW